MNAKLTFLTLFLAISINGFAQVPVLRNYCQEAAWFVDRFKYEEGIPHLENCLEHAQSLKERSSLHAFLSKAYGQVKNTAVSDSFRNRIMTDENNANYFGLITLLRQYAFINIMRNPEKSIKYYRKIDSIATIMGDKEK